MGKQTLRTLILGTSALAVAWGCDLAPAVAQDISGLTGRLERIERDLMVLQRQIYRTQVDGSSQSTAAPATGASAASSVVKLGELEEQIRDLTGQVETLTFQIQQNKERMDRMNADIDFRLQRLEGTAPATPVAASPTSGAAAQQLVQPAPTGVMPAKPGTSKVTLTPPPGTPAPVASAPLTAAPAQPQLQIPTQPVGNPREDYTKAFRLLQKGDYNAAETAFQNFLAVHKDDALAGNAQYWLGETYYVRGQFEKAAVTFADGYKSYRTSPKAADSLLKLGFSMRKLGKEAQSCAAYGQLLKEFPKSSKVIVQLAQKARKELKCP